MPLAASSAAPIQRIGVTHVYCWVQKQLRSAKSFKLPQNVDTQVSLVGSLQKKSEVSCKYALVRGTNICVGPQYA